VSSAELQGDADLNAATYGDGHERKRKDAKWGSGLCVSAQPPCDGEGDNGRAVQKFSMSRKSLKDIKKEYLTSATAVPRPQERSDRKGNGQHEGESRCYNDRTGGAYFFANEPIANRGWGKGCEKSRLTGGVHYMVHQAKIVSGRGKLKHEGKLPPPRVK